MGTSDNNATPSEWELSLLEFYTFILLIVSMVLLLVAFGEYIYYLRRFKAKQSWKLMSLVTTYFVMNFVEFINLAFIEPGTRYCVVSAIITHYLRLSVAINLSLVGLGVVMLIYMINYNKKSFKAMFFVLSYGSPIIVVLICSLVFLDDYRYDYTFQCLVYGDSEFFGLRLPLTFILTINFIYFIAVIVRILMQNHRRQILRRETIRSTPSSLRRSFSMRKTELRFYAKLFCVTGPIWMLGVLSSYAESSAAYWIRLLASTTQGSFVAIVVLIEICRNFGSVMETTNTILRYDDDAD